MRHAFGMILVGMAAIFPVGPWQGGHPPRLWQAPDITLDGVVRFDQRCGEHVIENDHARVTLTPDAVREMHKWPFVIEGAKVRAAGALQRLRYHDPYGQYVAEVWIDRIEVSQPGGDMVIWLCTTGQQTSLLTIFDPERDSRK